MTSTVRGSVSDGVESVIDDVYGAIDGSDGRSLQRRSAPGRWPDHSLETAKTDLHPAAGYVCR